jgi:hypothetical protein
MWKASLFSKIVISTQVKEVKEGWSTGKLVAH